MSVSTPIIFSLEPHPLEQSLSEKLVADKGCLSWRRFPDGESFLRVDTDVKNRHCMILADLSHPDSKFLALLFLAETLKELGALSTGLLAPYLSYMRQDRRFVDGEAVTSRIFAAEVSAHFDWLVTVDPHLHRYHSLDEIYTIPNYVVQGAPVLADWLADEKNLILVGPDAESEQWVSEIASYSGHPYIVGAKQRRGDRDVVITLPELSSFRGREAVIIDDVISSGHTVLECLRVLNNNGFHEVSCVCVHGIFADNVDERLLESGMSRLVSCNTVVHSSNALDVSKLLVTPVNELIGELNNR